MRDPLLATLRNLLLGLLPLTAQDFLVLTAVIFTIDSISGVTLGLILMRVALTRRHLGRRLHR